MTTPYHGWSVQPEFSPGSARVLLSRSFSPEYFPTQPETATKCPILLLLVIVLITASVAPEQEHDYEHEQAGRRCDDGGFKIVASSHDLDRY